MKLSIGILIIGSLYWDPDRKSWRDDRLQMGESFYVRAPIRYGRRSRNRGDTYTMVFSSQCKPGQAIVVRCRADITATADLNTEAQYLWTAERLEKPNGRICGNWGSVALLRHPGQHVPQQLLDDWATHVSNEKDYGRIPQAANEGCLVTDRGILQIPWPTVIDSDEALPMDLLLATATHPTLLGEPKSYPDPETIAHAWQCDRNGNVTYFRNNVEAGIHSFEDDAISARLRLPLGQHQNP